MAAAKRNARPDYADYAEYAARTQRRIPVLVLTRRAGQGGGSGLPIP
ncbi:MAG: hypothetical protein QNK05_21705 [Myxococcota bacterium]|nr:hypothetical protein [Myxococcota bacterium]